VYSWPDLVHGAEWMVATAYCVDNTVVVVVVVVERDVADVDKVSSAVAVVSIVDEKVKHLLPLQISSMIGPKSYYHGDHERR